MDQYSREFIAEKARLRPEDLGLVRTARRSHNQLGLAYQIAFIRLTGRAPGQQPFEILEDLVGLCGNGAECESPRSRSLCAAPANALGPSGEGPRAPRGDRSCFERGGLGWPDDLNFELLSHISPIGWDNVLLYGEYQLNRSLVRSERLSV